ncbi:transglycosylase SLT domain-containing protein [Streptomyces aidingensis]|uniref:Transglycosylase SLT domain-containing protein n=1 Tax=Streptomyces aidingensis TaxID=910347 RepID=A0A1I1LIU1_9ACTN|nr:transglycosylase SLT domain-containing protein [Streptomyces aidingensis]SFC72905.1 Transglycosylase SLT domain-containing protein [Streptomyces aidingensis]
MPSYRLPSLRRIPVAQKVTAGSLLTAGVAALAFTAVPAPASADGREVRSLAADTAAWDTGTGGAAGQQQDPGSRWEIPLHGDAEQEHGMLVARKAAEFEAAAEKKHEAEAQAEAEQRAAEQRAAEQQEAGRSGERTQVVQAATTTAAYADNLDGWINEALDIMAANGIPGSYDGLHRNIMRESSGNPNAINNWDINAINGTPSIGLLQVIQPTFDAYHVPGTPYDIYDPVANIVAAANYAWDRYGSIDNVFGAY